MSERLKSVEDLVAFLVKGGVPHQADVANGIVQVATRPPALPIPVIVRFETVHPSLPANRRRSAQRPGADSGRE